MASYRYKASGLDNVILEGVDVVQDDAGQRVVSIPNIEGLHRAIAQAVVEKPTALDGREWRFLRTEMGLTQAQLAEIMKREALTISRWERAETPIDPTADTLFRLLVIEKLALERGDTIEDVAKRSIIGTGGEPIRIDGSDPSAYRPIPHAA
jgi:DNA-binding transcriptional regulator YiaG